jgi:hypothetical protein
MVKIPKAIYMSFTMGFGVFTMIPMWGVNLPWLGNSNNKRSKIKMYFAKWWY